MNWRKIKKRVLVRKTPVYKLVIHYQGGDQYLAVRQNRLAFLKPETVLECSSEDAIWNSSIGPRMTSVELITFVEKYAAQISNISPSGEAVLPFLIRHALLNHGVPVEARGLRNIQRFGNFWVEPQTGLERLDAQILV